MAHVHLILRAARGRARLLLLSTALGFAACGDAGAQDRPTPEQSATDWLEVSLSKPPFAGTHQVTGDMACFAQDGIWGAGITLDRDRGLTNMLLMLTGVPASGGSTQEVQFALTFGQIDDMSANAAGGIGIGSLAGGGTGTATVEREGGAAVIRVEGTTHYGARVSAVIRCRTVS